MQYKHLYYKNIKSLTFILILFNYKMINGIYQTLIVVPPDRLTKDKLKRRNSLASFHHLTDFVVLFKFNSFKAL